MSAWDGKYTAYIAGPMTGHPDYNFGTFNEIREHLYLRGLPAPFLTEDIVVINPAENFNGDQTLPRRVYLSLAVRQVQNADGIVLLPEWHQSPGAQLEAQLGLDLDRDFYVAHKRDDINWEIGRTSHEVIQNVLNAMSEDLDPAFQPYLIFDGEPLTDNGTLTRFASGATRDTQAGKLDYEGFYHPLVVERFAWYMDRNRVQSDGNLRDSDNWQKGFTRASYMKSMWRHFMDAWKWHRGWQSDATHEDALCGVIFNAQGYLHELLIDRDLTE